MKQSNTNFNYLSFQLRKQALETVIQEFTIVRRGLSTAEIKCEYLVGYLKGINETLELIQSPVTPVLMETAVRQLFYGTPQQVNLIYNSINTELENLRRQV